MTTQIDNLINAALARRRRLIDAGVTDAFRVLHDAADGTPGLVVERFGPVLIVQLHEGRWQADVSAARGIVEAVQHRLGTRSAYQKRFVRDRAEISTEAAGQHVSSTPWLGEPAPDEFTITEHGATYLIRPHDGFSVGLFLEHRENRRRIRALARGKRVLNGFAYTCAFSVAAAIGGAAMVASVDASKRYLEWGKRNFAANELALDPNRFFCDDMFEFYKRARRQQMQFDFIILDPPTFSRMRRPQRVFSMDQDVGRLAAGAMELLAPGGTLFFSTNYRQMSIKRMEAEIIAAAAGRICKIAERPALPVDFAGDPDYSRSLLVRVA